LGFILGMEEQDEVVMRELLYYRLADFPAENKFCGGPYFSLRPRLSELLVVILELLCYLRRIFAAENGFCDGPGSTSL
jgi:hypothetical protein